MASTDSINFPKAEEEVLRYWKEIDAFQTSYKQSQGKPRYVFYDGPPFATGLPHYGHILAGTVKDTVTRWAHQSGFQVERRFGWDCHGLPVEYEIDKLLGVKSPQDVEKMGIDKYNQECRKIVMRYSSEWETIVTRLGRWIDFKNDYKTMYPWFMESIWWVFKQLYNKGLVYRGFKVMPFSTACSTPLSNFESGQNYKDVDDPSVVVTFPLLNDATTSLVAWTTTPWTLPSNLALCVNPDLDYVKIKDAKSDRVYIMMEARICQLYSQPEQYSVIQKMKGSELEGLHYKPLFDYFIGMKSHGAFRVLTDTYVSSDAGTGVVHQAPYFGEDDYRICMRNSIINKNMPPVCPIDMAGHFVEPVCDFIGVHVKQADKEIIKHLKHSGRLLQAATVRHSYPFCWRSDTPLIYRAVPSWFIRVEEFKQRLLKTNAQTYWVPDFVKEKRFGNWLKDARDWAVSRNRYWGTPIPIWTSEDGQEVVCVGSIDELKALTGVTDVTDLHREFIDHLTIPSSRGPDHPPLRRVSEVFDCWFESGSMPYAANHYPFQDRQRFEQHFPGHFIAEGIDQTRGWFYTLLVLSTALFDKPPFRNLICHGLVLASDGEKMSKRKQNYPDPMEVVQKYGADAVRLYLINSPVVRADNLRFKESGVKDVLKDVFLPWFNALKFLLQNLQRLKKEQNIAFVFNESHDFKPTNYMDRWIVSFTQSLIKFVHSEMKAYKLYTVVPQLLQFIQQLTNWYVRMNRKRLKGESLSSPTTGGADDDCTQALTTLFTVIYSMIKVMAPFVPFLTEHMYLLLKPYLQQSQQSVHFFMLPAPQEDLIEGEIERAVCRMQVVVDLCRVLREKNTLPIKYPLKEIVVIHQEGQVLEDISSLQKYIIQELNVRVVTVTNDKQKYKVHLKAEADHKKLGVRLKKDHKVVAAQIKELTDDQLQEFQRLGQMRVAGHILTAEDVKVTYSFSGGEQQPYEAKSDGDILVLLDITPDTGMFSEGLAREVINRAQKLRKKANLVPTDAITVYYSASGPLKTAIQQHIDFITSTLKQPLEAIDDFNAIASLTVANNWQDDEDKKMSQIKGDELKLAIIKGHHTTIPSTPSTTTLPTQSSTTTPSTTTPSTPMGPCCRWLNVELGGKSACILLENPTGSAVVSMNMLIHEVKLIFNLAPSSRLQMLQADRVVASADNLLNLHSTTLRVKLL